MGRLIIVRHGQTEYNLQKRFCGWTDVNLTEQGKEKAKRAGEYLKRRNIKIDYCFTSKLKRAQDTLAIILKELGQGNEKIVKTEQLNERDYGELTGKKHAEIEKKYGEEQVRLWRRSWLEQPPKGENLKMVYDRVVKFYKEEIEPIYAKNEEATVIIVAHGNSLRALTKYLDKISDKDIEKVELKTGKAIIKYV